MLKGICGREEFISETPVVTFLVRYAASHRALILVQVQETANGVGKNFAKEKIFETAQKTSGALPTEEDDGSSKHLRAGEIRHAGNYLGAGNIHRRQENQRLITMSRTECFDDLWAEIMDATGRLEQSQRATSSS
jgi:hypothetical protein